MRHSQNKFHFVEFSSDLTLLRSTLLWPAVIAPDLLSFAACTKPPSAFFAQMVREAGQNPRIAACPSTHVCSLSATLRCDVRLLEPSLCLARAERCEPLPTTPRLLAIARGRSVRRTRARAATRSHVDARCSAYTCGSCDLHQRPRAPRPLIPISCAQNQSIVNERTFATWPDFFNHTTIDVAPFGHCECYRVASGGALFFENRSVVTDCSASRPSFAPPSRHLLSG